MPVKLVTDNMKDIIISIKLLHLIVFESKQSGLLIDFGFRTV